MTQIGLCREEIPQIVVKLTGLQGTSVPGVPAAVVPEGPPPVAGSAIHGQALGICRVESV